MQVRVATICDYAQVREGLLNIVSAGINRIRLTEYPSAMPAMLALLVEAAPGEVRFPREIRLRAETEDGAPLAEAVSAFQLPVTPPAIDPGELLLLPFAVDLRPITLPVPGRYQIVVDLIDDADEPTPLAVRAELLPSEAAA